MRIVVGNSNVFGLNPKAPIHPTRPPKQPNVHCLYNHVRIVIKYNEDPAHFKGSRIVGFEVVPFSVKHQWDSQGGKAEFSADQTVLETCNDNKHIKVRGWASQVGCIEIDRGSPTNY